MAQDDCIFIAFGIVENQYGGVHCIAQGQAEILHLGLVIDDDGVGSESGYGERCQRVLQYVSALWVDGEQVAVQHGTAGQGAVGFFGTRCYCVDGGQENSGQH